jgi:hypothetical protein
LGDRFKNEVAWAVQLILKNPLHYTLKGKFREIKIDVFPYLMIYQVDKK